MGLHAWALQLCLHIHGCQPLNPLWAAQVMRRFDNGEVVVQKMLAMLSRDKCISIQAHLVVYGASEEGQRRGFRLVDWALFSHAW